MLENQFSFMCVVMCEHAGKEEKKEYIFNFCYRSLDLWTAFNGVAVHSTKPILCFDQNLKIKQNFFKSAADAKLLSSIPLTTIYFE